MHLHIDVCKFVAYLHLFATFFASELNVDASDILKYALAYANLHIALHLRICIKGKLNNLEEFAYLSKFA